MDTSNLKMTLERMSGMSHELRELLHSELPFLSINENLKASDLNNSSNRFETLQDRMFKLIDSANQFTKNNRIEVSRDCFIDDQKMDSDFILQTIDERLGRLKNLYNSRPMTSPAKRVVVVGGGPVGLRCAIGAALAGNKVLVIEQFEQDTRTRYLGLFAPEQQFLADIGAPLSMFVELSMKGVLKRLVTIADLQAFLTLIACRLDIEIHKHAKASFDKDSLAEGKINYTSLSLGTLEFDMLVDASGANSKLRRELVGDKVTGFRELCQNGFDIDGDAFTSYFSSFSPSGAGFICEQPHHMDYWKTFVEKTQMGHIDIFDNVCCFVGNIDKSAFRSNTIPDLDNSCPPDWIWKRFQKEKGKGKGIDDIFRVHLEGPFPQKYRDQILKTFHQKKGRFPTHVIRAFLKASNMDEVLDIAGWENYCFIENSSAESAHNTTSLFRCQLTGIKTHLKQPTLWGKIPGSKSKEYFIAGDAAQTPWYRFGVGIMDGFYSGNILDQLFFVSETDKRDLLLQWERYLRLRSVQVLFSIYFHDQMLCDNKMMKQVLKESGIALSD